METKSGVNYDKKLMHLNPWNRFDYLRRHLTKQIKEQGDDTKHLEIAKLRRTLKLSTADIRALQSGRLDMESFIGLAGIVGEDISVLIKDYEDKFPKPIKAKTDKEIDREGKKILDKAQSKSGSKAKKLGIELIFENRCLSNLSLEISGNRIVIYENHEAPKAAKVALVGRAELFMNGNSTERYFPEKVKI